MDERFWDEIIWGANKKKKNAILGLSVSKKHNAAANWELDLQIMLCFLWIVFQIHQKQKHKLN